MYSFFFSGIILEVEEWLQRNRMIPDHRDKKLWAQSEYGPKLKERKKESKERVKERDSEKERVKESERIKERKKRNKKTKKEKAYIFIFIFMGKAYLAKYFLVKIGYLEL